MIRLKNKAKATHGDQPLILGIVEKIGNALGGMDGETMKILDDAISNYKAKIVQFFNANEAPEAADRIIATLFESNIGLN